MYIWIAVLFNKDFESYIRENSKLAGVKNNLDFVAFDLPQHISLKISFPCKETDFSSIVEDIEMYFRNIESFTVALDNMELIKGENNIIWMNIKENTTLRKIHNDMNKKMLENYGIQLNEYDGEKFRFHSTLFVDDKNIGTGNYDNAFRELQDMQFNREQIIDNACVGLSKTGKMGEYEVYKMFDLGEKKSFTHM